jgi:Ca2+-transporting ATPase
MQVVVVCWSPAQAVFSTVDLSLQNWGLAGLVAGSVLALEEARKLVARCRSEGR